MKKAKIIEQVKRIYRLAKGDAAPDTFSQLARIEKISLEILLSETGNGKSETGKPSK